jgi:hypothetical protein
MPRHHAHGRLLVEFPVGDGYLVSEGWLLHSGQCHPRPKVR